MPKLKFWGPLSPSTRANPESACPRLPSPDTSALAKNSCFWPSNTHSRGLLKTPNALASRASRSPSPGVTHAQLNGPGHRTVPSGPGRPTNGLTVLRAQEVTALFAHAARHLAAAPLPAGPLSPPPCSPAAQPPPPPLLPPSLPALPPPRRPRRLVARPARAKVRADPPPLAARRPGPTHYLGTPLPVPVLFWGLRRCPPPTPPRQVWPRAPRLARHPRAPRPP
jgi:hypothetical protein